MKRLCALSLVCLVGCLLALSAGAQAQEVRLKLDRLGFDRPPQLKAYLTYVEADGSSLIHGKKAEDFDLLIDKKSQGKASALTIFERAREPVYVVFVVQISAAMEPALEELRKGLRLLGDAVARVPESRISVITYAENVKRLVDSGSPSEAGAASTRLKIDADATEAHMIDALTIAMDILRGQDKSKRRMVVLFSDGTDLKADKKAFEDFGRSAGKDGIAIDTVGFAPFEPGRLRSLIEMSRESGGTSRGAKNVDEIGKRFTSVAAGILRQYVALFDLRAKGGDGKAHVLQVVSQHDGKKVVSDEVTAELPAGIGGTARTIMGGCGCRVGGRL